MTTAERQIWIATFAAAYIAEVRSMKYGDVETTEDVAAGAASIASEALAMLKGVQMDGNGRLSRFAGRDLDQVLEVSSDSTEEKPL